MKLISLPQDGAEYAQRGLLGRVGLILPTFCAALALARAGQVWVAGGAHEAAGAAAFILATGLFLGPLMRQPGSWKQAGTAPAAFQPWLRSRIWRLAFAGIALLLAGFAWQGFADNRLAGGWWTWLAAFFSFLVAFAERPSTDWRTAVRRMRGIDRRLVLVLFAITLLGAFFRFYRLAGVPAEMTSDHAEKLLDVYDVLGGWRPIFFPRNTGREALQFYVTAGLIRFTPLTLSHLALKVGTAFFGMVTVPLAFLLGKELYGRPAGLLAAFFLAVSHWHVAITRVGLRFPFTAAFTVPALFFLLRAFKHNRRNDWLAAGMVLGLGLHTYTAMRIVPLLFLFLMAAKFIADYVAKKRGRPSTVEESSLVWRFWGNATLGGLASLLAFLPLLRFMWDKPGVFWYRAASRAQQGMAITDAWPIFWGNVKNALLMFNVRGDVVPVNTIPRAPVLGQAEAALFVLGTAYLLWRLFHERRAAYLLLSLFTLLLPSILSLAYPGENPSVVRAGGAVPLAMLVVALPVVAAGRRLWPASGRAGRTLAAFLLAGVLIFATADNFHWYFVRYDANVRRSLWNATEIGEAVRDYVATGGELEQVYHIPYPHWVDTRNIAINAGDITWRQAVSEIQEVRIHALNPEPKLYLLHPDDKLARDILRDVYPNGRLTRYHSQRPGKDFLLFRVPAR